MGIVGNEKADIKAKEAARRTVEMIPIHFKDYFSLIKTKFSEKVHRDRLNSTTMSKIRRLNPEFKPWPINIELRRREEVIINRLRLGHTNITHCHLMDNSTGLQTPTLCPYCNSVPITVEHIFIGCQRLENLRLVYFAPMTTWRLDSMLGVQCDTNKILNYLRAINITSHI